MSAIIEQLNQEHANMSRILDLLEHEIEAFGRGEVADFHLVQEIMDYCLDYPEACHHPKEDAIYAVMIDRRPNLADEIAEASLYLSLPKSAIITGETLVMDGGRGRLSGIIDDFDD